MGTDSFRVRCTSTGGRALDMTVSGPRGFTADISSRMEPVGNRRWLGSDQYTATTDLISGGEDGDEYECNVTSSTSTTGSVTLRGNILSTWLWTRGIHSYSDPLQCLILHYNLHLPHQSELAGLLHLKY